VSEASAARVAITGAALAVAAACGFMIAYAFGLPGWALGGCAALAFAGIASFLWAWSTGLVQPARVIEPRDVTPDSAARELALGRKVEADAAGLTRPELFTALSLGAGGMLAIAALFPLRSLGSRPAASGPPKPPPWRAGVRVVDIDGRPVHRDSLDVGSIATVFPEGAADDPTASVVLIRLHPKLTPEPRDWSPDGYIAFSKICTHVGCPVALYRKSVHELLCPCHQSRFDILARAKPVAGPASRPLPQLALVFDGRGELRARQGFLEPIGPAAWGQA